jgi:hypothetical protein
LTDVPVPSHRHMAVKLGPSTGGGPTVFFYADPDLLPWELRKEFRDSVGGMAGKKPEIREVLTDEPSSGKPHLATLKFVRGIRPDQALAIGRKLRSWFFQNLRQPADRREQAKLRKGRRLALRAQARHSRRTQRQKNRYRVRRPVLLLH